jgi:hypothetical protein
MPYLGCPPVLLLIFNRPDLTRQVFARIREARPGRLYIAADGPRQTRIGEYELCEEARKIAKEVDWPCEVKILFREKNLGCGKAVSEAISWLFENEQEGIILEDDCIPDGSFFRFCGELLELYRDEPRVMMIGGTFAGSGPHEFSKKSPNLSASYFFSRHVVCWGWATWRRAWNLFDYKITSWPRLRNTDWLHKISDGSQYHQKYWESSFQSIHNGIVDIWDFQWVFSVWFYNGLSIQPMKNLVTNIGYDENATHTKIGDGFANTLPNESIEFPLGHPDLIERNQEMDRWIDQLIAYLYGHSEHIDTLHKVYRWLVHKIAPLR